MKKLVVGILAHVDAGKTTLSEALLYSTGRLKKLGRVDSKNAFLDNNELERERGITIFSKQAVIKTDNTEITLLDTPGHVDFSSETERTLQVLDYAILVISARDGVQVHTETLWKLLSRYGVPTFVFVNKMDLEDTDKTVIMKNLQENLGEGLVDFSAEDDDFYENIALCDEMSMEKYMESGTLSTEEISVLIKERKVFPCFFGSALRLSGVEEFIEGIEKYTNQPKETEKFGAKVFKISRDNQGNRMTFMKITGGSFKVRSVVSYQPKDPSEAPVEEKANILRVYSGAKFEPIDEAKQGTVCAVLGLSKTYPGQGLGFEEGGFEPILEPVLNYRIKLPEGISEAQFLPKLKQLEDEDPQLHIVWNEQLRGIYACLMGEVQEEILKSMVLERFGVKIGLDEGRIIYRETIAEPVEGIGHFEPLRHYAEVHLILEPGEPGSGLRFETRCSEDNLDRNWQRLILTHLEEKTHMGVLTGSPVTDMKITLIAGRAHVKHTEGGDFRQATYRAVRQGLMKAKNVLLEPYYSFRLEVPSEQIGRAINDIREMEGTFSSPETKGDMVEISGRAPVSAMRSYLKEVLSYTHGRGKLFCFSDGFSPCHNAETVIAETGYDPEADILNTPDSVFCSHGAGVNVKWNEVERHMHVSSGVDFSSENGILLIPNVKVFRRNFSIDEKELEAIMEREFGPIRRKQYSEAVMDRPKEYKAAAPKKKDYLIVDGYNMIFAWEGLKKLANENLDAARHILMDILSNYRGYIKCELVLVFDGYKVKGNYGEKSDYHGIHVAYTKEGETGDMYIEKLVREIGKNYNVKVATSDNLIQVAALRSGVLRMSANELLEDIEAVNKQIQQTIEAYGKKGYYRPFDNIDKLI
ncbi:MAG: NYN domain-containing protein [Oscillospiraceae bacterium]|nr:NYN domain-containing protein [Oscillospiraceae bacterium]